MGVSEFNANSVDPNQTPQNAASDMSLYCLQMSFVRNTRLILVKEY